MLLKVFSTILGAFFIAFGVFCQSVGASLLLTLPSYFIAAMVLIDGYAPRLSFWLNTIDCGQMIKSVRRWVAVRHQDKR